jgi:multidrug efflux pump subunit AcrA (membrane-fusion protein)
VYRWFPATAKVEAQALPAYTFPSAGRVAEVLGPGTRFAPGTVLALLEGGRQPRAELMHHRSRLEAYKLLNKTAVDNNDRPEIRQTTLKIEQKKKLVAEAEAALAQHAIIATQAGEVAEAVVEVGARVAAGAPALRAKGGGLRAVFELPREDVEAVRRLGFWRVEIDGRPFDGALSAHGTDDSHVVIDLPNDPAITAGKAVRLAKSRLAAVFSLPSSAIVRVSDTDRLFIVVGGRAEMRVVAVPERNDKEAIVTQGLDIGDQVVVDPQGLKADSPVLVKDTVRQ